MLTALNHNGGLPYVPGPGRKLQTMWWSWSWETYKKEDILYLVCLVLHLEGHTHVDLNLNIKLMPQLYPSLVISFIKFMPALCLHHDQASWCNIHWIECTCTVHEHNLYVHTCMYISKHYSGTSYEHQLANYMYINSAQPSLMLVWALQAMSKLHFWGACVFVGACRPAILAQGCLGDWFWIHPFINSW